VAAVAEEEHRLDAQQAVGLERSLDAKAVVVRDARAPEQRVQPAQWAGARWAPEQ